MSLSDEDFKLSGDEENCKQEPESEDEDMNDDNIMKILIATDIHLGYEQTTKRAQNDDSFRTFEEILQYAKEKDVDMVLLGGDLFHEAKPPHNVVMQCLNLLRKYCLNDKPVKIQFLSDPKVVFSHCFHKTVNYEDPNLNVGIPVFSIHGNHDDPSFGAIGSMDVLSSTGLINYFGKWTDVTQVSIPPLYIRKGVTTVALYGLSYMNDQRLSRLMRNNRFHMLRSDQIEDPFNIFVLHQNRAQHSQNSYVSENLLPEFLHMVIWGHEHECLIDPVKSKLNNKIHICQPGSSVATSLAQGESVTKHIGILNVYKSKFKMDVLKLNTVRPFVFEDLVLHDCNHEISSEKSRTEAVEEFVDNYIENTLIPEVAKQQTGHPAQPEQPLIRLRIFYTDDKDAFDPLRLSQKYYHVVANPNDMLLFRKCTAKLRKKDITKENQDLEEIGEIFRFDDNSKDWKRTVQGGMAEYFNQEDKVNKLTVLSLTGLNNALSRFVNTNDGKAFQDLVRHQMRKTVDYLLKDNSNFKVKTEVIEAIKNFRDTRLEKLKETKQEEENFLNSRNGSGVKDSRNRSSTAEDDDEDNFDNPNNNMEVEPDEPDEPAPTRGRGRGRGRGKGRGATKAKDPPAPSPVKRSRSRASNNVTALDVTTTSRSSQSINSWKKPSNNSTSSSVRTKKPIVLDSDSE